MVLIEEKHTDLTQKHIRLHDSVVYGTTIGLKKKVNEDSLKIKIKPSLIQIFLADGHWGKDASEISVNFLFDNLKAFPINLKKSIQIVDKIEKKIFKEYGKAHMNPEMDFTPETSLLAVEINLENHNIKFFSYGDCRLNIYRNSKIIYEMQTKQTWLGAFSHLQLRKRKTISETLVFESLELRKDDLILLYTDGVDECIYQTPTLNTLDFERFTVSNDPEVIFDTIMQEVFTYGAEDNASLAIIKV